MKKGPDIYKRPDVEGESMTESLTVARYFKYVFMTVTSNTSNVG